MGKIAILGDSHFGASGSSDIIHKYFTKFYSFFFDYLDKESIKSVIQLGDLFDRRKEVHFTTIYESRKYFFDPIKEHSIQLYVIAGNHDILYKNSSKVNSLSLLKGTDIIVIDQFPDTHMVEGIPIDFYPWINQENISKTKELADSTLSEFCVGHFEFANFPMCPGNIAEHGMDHRMFSRYTKAFSGHYHTQSTKDQVRYIGTPCELTWSDCSDPKGFWVLDTITKKLEFIQNPFTLFKKISYVEGMKFDFASVKDHFVKVVVIHKESQKKFDAFLDSLKLNSPHDIKVIESSFESAVSQAVQESPEALTTNQMIIDVIDSIDIKLDKKILKEKILLLYVEANEITNSL